MNNETIHRIACIGGGLIGSSWATLFCKQDYPVSLYDIDEAQLTLAQEHVRHNFDLLVHYEVLTQARAQEAQKKIIYTTDLEQALHNVQLVQESGPERYEVKQEILRQVDELAGPEIIFASSTSGLLISKISEFSKYPWRCVCAHPYNPPHLVPLVELVGPAGSENTLAALKEFYASLGKEPIILNKEVPGFVGNRLQAAIGREIIDLVMHGVCTVEDADKALTFGPGLRWAIMGQNLLYQLGGGKDGVRGLYQKIGGDPNRKTWLDDMAKWTKYPPEWPEIAQAGVDAAIKDRPPEIGNTCQSLAQYRDKMLLELLKLHGKL